MSQTYLGIITSLIGVYVLPKLGIDVDNGALGTTIQTLVIIGGALWALIRRYQAGGITVAGTRI